MAKLSVSDKAHRVLVFLIGLRNRHARRALMALGFTQADLDEGWRLFRESARVQLDLEPPEPPVEENVIGDLDAWENRWFPIAGATLARRHPAIHARFFLNLTQTEGPGVVMSVGTFVERFDALGKSPADGKEGKVAKALLVKRGITPAVIDEARALLAAVEQPNGDDDASFDADHDAQEEVIVTADEALWGWYLEWTRIARAAISDRMVLRKLGFLATRHDKKGKTNGASELEPPNVDAPAEPGG